MHIDYWAVLIAALVNVAIGGVWYSKWMFGGIGEKVRKPRQGRILPVLFGLLASCLLAFFLAFFAAGLGAVTVSDGAFVGFCAWLGFVLPTRAGSLIWTEEPFFLFSIDAGYRLLSFVAMGGILGA